MGYILPFSILEISLNMNGTCKAAEDDSMIIARTPVVRLCGIRSLLWKVEIQRP